MRQSLYNITIGYKESVFNMPHGEKNHEHKGEGGGRTTETANQHTCQQDSPAESGPHTKPLGQQGITAEHGTQHKTAPQKSPCWIFGCPMDQPPPHTHHNTRRTEVRRQSY
jgi:hypothetical protein